MYKVYSIKSHLTYLLFVCLISCSKTNPKEDIKNINGYWEIEKVLLPDGSTKEYSFNPVIDFFEINDTIGIRKKVHPKFNGNYITSHNSESFTIHIKNDSISLHYKTSLTSWKETVISIKENKMVLKNKEGNVYFYKRHQKIKL